MLARVSHRGAERVRVESPGCDSDPSTGTKDSPRSALSGHAERGQLRAHSPRGTHPKFQTVRRSQIRDGGPPTRAPTSPSRRRATLGRSRQKGQNVSSVSSPNGLGGISAIQTDLERDTHPMMFGDWRVENDTYRRLGAGC